MFSKESVTATIIKPTLNQIENNIIVVPKSFIVKSQHSIRWTDRFAVIIEGRRFENRRLDRENRIGGLGLNGKMSFGESLRLEIRDGALIIERAA